MSMNPQKNMRIWEKIAEAAAGMVCGVIAFVMHIFALSLSDAGAALSGDEPVAWGMIFWTYAAGGALLGLTLGERFFRYLEDRWFKRP
jgi:hypothetical protein